MNIKVWTKQSNHFIREAGKWLQSKQEKAELSNGQVEGEMVSFTNLSEAQFCAFENTAARMGLEYDGSQEVKADRRSLEEEAAQLLLDIAEAERNLKVLAHTSEEYPGELDQPIGNLATGIAQARARYAEVEKELRNGI